MVSFNGSGSDPDGMIASYSWVFGDGGSSTQQNPSYTYSSGGAYAATLTATDNGGATASANVPIWVGTPGGTLPPTANAGADQSNLDPGVTVTLNGAGSTDPNGDALTYQWTQLTGPMVTLSGPNTAAPSFVAPLATTAIYTFRLTVMDNGAPPLGAQDLVNVSTRVTYNNTIQAWFADRGTQPNGEKLGCAIAGCHVPGTDRVPLTNYQEVFAERTKNRNRLAPGGSMRKYMLLTPRSEPDSTVKWLDNGAPQMN
jgi:PKD repeat protein